MKTKLLSGLFFLLLNTGLFAQFTPVSCDKITVDSVLNSELNKNNIELIITNHDSTTAWSPWNFTVLASNGDTVGHIILCQGCVILMHNRTGKFYLPKNDTNFVIPAHYCCKLNLVSSNPQPCVKDYNTCIVAGVQENTSEKNTFTLFPNPANKSFQIASKSEDGFPLNFRITNLRGQELHQGYINPQSNSIDISDLVPGIYFVGLYQHENLQGMQKLIVE